MGGSGERGSALRQPPRTIRAHLRWELLDGSGRSEQPSGDRHPRGMAHVGVCGWPSRHTDIDRCADQHVDAEPQSDPDSNVDGDGLAHRGACSRMARGSASALGEQRAIPGRHLDRDAFRGRRQCARRRRGLPGLGRWSHMAPADEHRRRCIPDEAGGWPRRRGGSGSDRRAPGELVFKRWARVDSAPGRLSDTGRRHRHGRGHRRRRQGRRLACRRAPGPAVQPRLWAHSQPSVCLDVEGRRRVDEGLRPEGVPGGRHGCRRPRDRRVCRRRHRFGPCRDLDVARWVGLVACPGRPHVPRQAIDSRDRGRCAGWGRDRAREWSLGIRPVSTPGGQPTG